MMSVASNRRVHVLEISSSDWRKVAQRCLIIRNNDLNIHKCDSNRRHCSIFQNKLNDISIVYESIVHKFNQTKVQVSAFNWCIRNSAGSHAEHLKSACSDDHTLNKYSTFICTKNKNWKQMDNESVIWLYETFSTLFLARCNCWILQLVFVLFLNIATTFPWKTNCLKIRSYTSHIHLHTATSFLFFCELIEKKDNYYTVKNYYPFCNKVIAT